MAETKCPITRNKMAQGTLICQRMTSIKMMGVNKRGGNTCSDDQYASMIRAVEAAEDLILQDSTTDKKNSFFLQYLLVYELDNVYNVQWVFMVNNMISYFGMAWVCINVSLHPLQIPQMGSARTIFSLLSLFSP